MLPGLRGLHEVKAQTLEEALTAKEEELAAKDKELASKDRELGVKDEEIAVALAATAAKEEELAAKEEELAATVAGRERDRERHMEELKQLRAQLARLEEGVPP
jgi:threonine dehydratase